MNEKEVFDEEPNETPMQDDADFALLDEAVRSNRAGLIGAEVKNLLNDVLKDYREDPSNALVRNSFAYVLDAVVTLAVKGLQRRYPAMAMYGEEIKQDAWERLLNQEAKHGQFLANYDFDLEAKKQVYGYAWKNVWYASADIWKELKKTRSSDTSWGDRENREAQRDTALYGGDSGETPSNKDAKKSGGYHEVSLSEFEADDKFAVEDGKRPMTPKSLHVNYMQVTQTETFLRGEDSFIRIGELKHWLEQLSDEMVGQTREWRDDTGELKRVIFSNNHSLIWRQWLGFSDPKLIGLNEKELSDELGFSLPKLKRYSSEAFEYMRQHPGYLELLEMMIPKRKPAIGHDIKAAIEARGGRGNFRKMIHAWLVLHVEFSKKLADIDRQQVVSRAG